MVSLEEQFGSVTGHYAALLELQSEMQATPRSKYRNSPSTEADMDPPRVPGCDSHCPLGSPVKCTDEIARLLGMTLYRSASGATPLMGYQGPLNGS